MLDACVISRDEANTGVYLTWRNLDNRAVESMSLMLSCYGGGDELLAFSSHQYTHLHVMQSACFGGDILIPLDIDDPERVSVELKSVSFANGESWLLKGESVFTLPLEKTLDKQHNQANAVKGQNSMEKKQNAAPQKENNGKKNIPPKVWIAAAAVLLLVAVCVGIFCGIPEQKYQAAQKLIDEGRYDEASQAFADMGNYKDAQEMVTGVYYLEGEALLAKGDREGAIAAFSKAGDYTDALERIDAVQYQNAQALLAEGQEDAAYDLFAAIAHYNDAGERALQIRLNQAARAMEQRDFTAAAAIFAAIGQDENAAIYQQARAWAEVGQYVQAAAAYQYVIDYQDSKEQVYQCALTASAKKDYEVSTALYAFLGDYQDSALRLNADCYAQAEALMLSGDYLGAAQAFDAIQDYADSVIRAKEARYAAANQMLENGDFAGAKAAFSALSGYQNSAEMVKEADYRAAKAAYDAGDYQQAVALYAGIVDYKDSAELLQAANYAYAGAMLAQGQYDEAIEGFIALRDYQESEALLLEAYYFKARQLGDQGDLAGAYEYFLLAGQHGDAADQAVEYAYAQGFSLQQQGRFEEALLWYTRCPGHVEVPQQKLLIGEGYFAAQEYEKALAILKEVSSLNGAAEYLYQIGQYFESANDLVQAYTAYTYAGSFQDSEQKAASLMDGMTAQAGRLLAQGQYEKADALFETLARSGYITEESLQAEFFAFLAQPGRKITLGSYPQDESGIPAPVVWRVMTTSNGFATLLSDKLLGCAQYDARANDSLENYLKTLTVMFSAEEKAVAGNFYIMTQETVRKLMPSAADRMTVPTAYAKTRSIETGVNRTEGVWTATAADSYNYVIYDFATGQMGQNSLYFKTNYVRPAMELLLNQHLYRLLSDPANGYRFYDDQGAEVEFTSRYQ